MSNYFTSISDNEIKNEIKKISKKILKEAILTRKDLKQIRDDVLKEYLIKGKLPISFSNPNNIDNSISEKINLEKISSFIEKYCTEKVYLKDRIVLNPHLDKSNFDIEKEISKKSSALELPTFPLDSYVFFGEYSYDFIITKNKIKEWNIYFFYDFDKNNNLPLDAWLLALILKEIFDIDEINFIDFETEDYVNKFPNSSISAQKDSSISAHKDTWFELIKTTTNTYLEEKLSFNEYLSYSDKEINKNLLDEGSISDNDSLVWLCYDEIVFLDFSPQGEENAN